MPTRPVSQVVSRRTFLKAPGTTSAAEAARLMREHHKSTVTIVNAAGCVEGICSERDLVQKVMATGRDPAATPLMLALAEGIAGDAGSARRLLGAFGFPGDAVFRRFADLSAGEKMRLRILLIGKSPRPASVILSDEAETGLDRKSVV